MRKWILRIKCWRTASQSQRLLSMTSSPALINSRAGAQLRRAGEAGKIFLVLHFLWQPSHPHLHLARLLSQSRRFQLNANSVGILRRLLVSRQLLLNAEKEINQVCMCYFFFHIQCTEVSSDYHQGHLIITQGYAHNSIGSPAVCCQECLAEE